MNNIIILDTHDIVVIAICWVIGTFVGGFLKAWYQDIITKKRRKKLINSMREHNENMIRMVNEMGSINKIQK